MLCRVVLKELIKLYRIRNIHVLKNKKKESIVLNSFCFINYILI